MKMYVFLLNGLLLNACSQLPETLKNPPTPDVQVQETLSDSSSHLGRQVRWGGKLIEVQNNPDETILHILAFPLNYTGRPDLDEPAQGRFLVKTDNFLDPAVYAKDSEITAAGQLVHLADHRIGQKNLKVPVISLKDLYLWPEYRQSYYPNCGYGPYYGGYGYGGFRSFYRPYGFYRYGRGYY